MAGNYDDGEIYYDNMEIMESIEKLKISRKSPAMTHSIKQIVRLPTSAEASEKPPVLPPKKKNMKPQSPTSKGSKSTSEKLPLESSPKPQNRSPQPTSNKNIAQVAAAKPLQVWNHPGLLRTRSIVEEPLAPIVEEEQDASPMDSFAESNTSVESPSSERTHTDVNQNGSIPQKCPTPVAESRSNTSKVSPVHIPGSVSSRPAEKDNTQNNRTPEFDAHSKFEAGFYNHDVERDNFVRPYGMVDVRLVENTVEMNSRQIQPKSHTFSQNAAIRPASPTRSSNISDENGIRPNTGKGGASTSLSSAREPEFRIVGTGNLEDSHDSSRNSFDQDFSNGVCAYMSIPIHSAETSVSAAAKMHQLPLRQLGPNGAKMNGAGVKNFYKDDEYIYDEIEDFVKDSSSMQQAFSDIDKVLESIGNEDISGTSSIAPKRFPVVADKGTRDNAQYDNFFYGGHEDQRPNFSQNWNVRSKPSLPTKPPVPSTMENQMRTTNASRPEVMRSGNSLIHSPTGAFSNYVPVHSDASGGEDKRYDYSQSSKARSLPRMNSGIKLNISTEDKDSGERELSESSGSSIPYRSGISDHQDNTSTSESRNKSRQSLDKTGSDSVSRQSSKADIDGSSEGDSYSFSGLHGETIPSRRKSSGNALSSIENLKGSSKSLGRSNSCERKKSSFRSKFKFRTRSKSQDRLYGDSDSIGHLSGVSDADEKVSHPRQRGSRLRRRLSRKRMENKETADRKSLEGYDAEAERSRASTPVSFIRKLLRKSKSGEEESSQTQRKPGPNSSGSEDSFGRTSSSGQNQNQTDSQRDKHLISPPSRRARKMLHSRQAREKAVVSDSTNSDSDSGLGNFRSGETLKRGDEYLEPCEPSFQPKDSSRERGRKGNSQRMKGTRGRRPERDVERSEVSSFHRDKYRALVSLNAQTLKKIAEKWLTEWRNRLPVGGFLITSWADIVIASKRPQCILGRTVVYEAYFSTNPGHRLACQIFDKTDVNQRLIRQLENCSTLIAHPNLCSVCSHFHCKIPGSLMYPPRDEGHSEALCVVLANVPATSLTTYVGRLREVKEQKQVHKQILLMVLQLLQALDNLSRSGFNLSYINADHLIVTQEMGLLQILPHMADTDDTRTTSPGKPTMIQQISGLLSWMLQGCLDPVAMSSHSSHSTYLASLKRISQVLTSSPHDFSIGTLQSLVQCAVWGPRSAADIDTTHESVLEALAAWIDVKQAELVSDIAVLFSAKSDFLPIYMFYKHQYFSRIDPKNLYQNLRILGRI